jgi:hypothetical protein
MVISYARDATRVEVVLEECCLVGVEADDRDAVWGVGMLDLPSLDEEASARQPLEGGACARSVGRVRGERGDHAPLSDEDIERPERLLVSRWSHRRPFVSDE